MSLSNTVETELLQHLMENANIADIGDATGLRGSTVAGDYWIVLHTADPGEAGTATTSEAAYGSYARFQIGRSSSNWTTVAGTTDNDNVISFPQATSGSETITHFSVTVASTGATKIVVRGALSTPLAVSTLIVPEFAAGDLNITAD